MKKLLVALITLSCLLSGSLFADPLVTPVDSAKITRDAQILKGLEALGSYVLKYDTTGADTLAQAGHKTWAQVLDHGLSLLTDAVKEIAATIEKAVPIVFKIMVKQQIAKALAGLAIPTAFCLFFIIYYLFINHKWKPDLDKTVEGMINSSDSGWGFFWRIGFTKFIPLFGFIIASAFCINAIQNAMLLTMNPAYFAIRDLLVLMLGKGQNL